jgi:Zn-finger nucleic acid-binding protein
MNCPSCRQPLHAQTFAGNYGTTVPLDFCDTCQSIWFDSHENLRLSAKAILHLFRIIHEKYAEHRRPLSERMSCPQCGIQLTHTSDRQRNTQFHYFACERGHGRFITFFQFLREKNFVRSLSPKEVAELKTHLTTLNCSQCGAVVDIDKTLQCTYCRAPISMLDSRQVEKTLHELRQKEKKQQAADPLLHSTLVFDLLKAEAANRRQHEHLSAALDPLMWQGVNDLVGAGISALLDTLLDIG